MPRSNGKSTPGRTAAAGTMVVRCGVRSLATVHWSKPA